MRRKGYQNTRPDRQPVPQSKSQSISSTHGLMKSIGAEYTAGLTMRKSLKNSFFVSLYRTSESTLFFKIARIRAHDQLDLCQKKKKQRKEKQAYEKPKLENGSDISIKSEVQNRKKFNPLQLSLFGKKKKDESESSDKKIHKEKKNRNRKSFNPLSLSLFGRKKKKDESESSDKQIHKEELDANVPNKCALSSQLLQEEHVQQLEENEEHVSSIKEAPVEELEENEEHVSSSIKEAPVEQARIEKEDLSADDVSSHKGALIEDEGAEVYNEESYFYSCFSSFSADLNLTEIFNEEAEDFTFYSCSSSPFHEHPDADNIEEISKVENHDLSSLLSYPYNQPDDIIEEPEEIVNKKDDTSAGLLPLSAQLQPTMEESSSAAILPRFSRYEQVGVGLKNEDGYTCYVNSVLQCLIHTPALVTALWSNNHDCETHGFCTVCELKALIEKSFNNSSSAISPDEFIKNLLYFSSDFVEFQHADSHEFLVRILDRLEERLPNRVIPRIFEGQIRSELKCCHCGHTSQKPEPFSNLSLELDKSSKTLEEVINSYLRVEYVDGFRCEGCGEAGFQTEKKNSVIQAPEVLIIQLKRVQNTGWFNRKLSRKIKYPTELNMAPFLPPSDPQENIMYDLYALIEHEGWSFGGHYTNLIRTGEAQWHHYSDSDVRTRSEKYALNRSAYILFYKRRNPTPPRFNYIN